MLSSMDAVDWARRTQSPLSRACALVVAPINEDLALWQGHRHYYLHYILLLIGPHALLARRYKTNTRSSDNG